MTPFRKVNLQQDDSCVYIILVNYNNINDTIQCVLSLDALTYQNFKMLLVDNCSTDESLQVLNNWCAKDLRQIKRLPTETNEQVNGHSFLNGKKKTIVNLFEAKKNGGFACGCNLAINYAIKQKDCSFVWLLNNDAVVAERALTELVVAAEKDNKIGVVGSKVLYLEQSNLLQNIGSKVSKWSFFKLPKPILNLKDKHYDDGSYEVDIDVDDVMGASMLLKRHVITKVGLMPEQYFLYGEETDWNYKIQKSGFVLRTAMKSKVFHKKSASVGGDQSSLALYYRTRNQLILQKKYMSSFKFYIFLIVYVVRKFVKSMSYNLELGKYMRDGLIDGVRATLLK